MCGPCTHVFVGGWGVRAVLYKLECFFLKKQGGLTLSLSRNACPPTHTRTPAHRRAHTPSFLLAEREKKGHTLIRTGLRILDEA